jgi:hypothetical protein
MRAHAKHTERTITQQRSESGQIDTTDSESEVKFRRPDSESEAQHGHRVHSNAHKEPPAHGRSHPDMGRHTQSPQAHMQTYNERNNVTSTSADIVSTSADERNNIVTSTSANAVSCCHQARLPQCVLIRASALDAVTVTRNAQNLSACSVRVVEWTPNELIRVVKFGPTELSSYDEGITAPSKCCVVSESESIRQFGAAEVELTCFEDTSVHVLSRDGAFMWRYVCLSVCIPVFPAVGCNR